MKSRATKALKQQVDHSRTKNMDLVDVAIKAKRMAAEAEMQDVQETAPVTLVPVKTPLDGQIEQHRQAEQKLKQRQAVGKETGNPLNFDFSKTGNREEKPSKKLELRLFDVG